MLRKLNKPISFKKGQKWEEKQPNDTSSMFSILLLLIFTNYNIEPSIPDESTAELKLTELLQSVNEKPECFGKTPTVKTVMREIPNFEPLHVPSRIGRPNLPTNQH
jgi:hypothetical protein